LLVGPPLDRSWPSCSSAPASLPTTRTTIGACS
jgi:hypothetical protein